MSAKQNKENLLRELIHKSWHRGCKETDILLGYFAKSKLSQMEDSFLATYKNLIAEPDWDIYAWLTKEQTPPAKYAKVIEEISNYHANGRESF